LKDFSEVKMPQTSLTKELRTCEPETSFKVK
jgi:hypothetical protein